MRVFVVVNAEGGTVQSGGIDPDGLGAAFAEAGLDAEVVFSAGAEVQRHAEQALAAATAGRIDAVVVGGGDGTVGAVAGVLAGSGVPLGVLPLGTLNHFAKDLGLPQDVAGAVRVIAAGADARRRRRRGQRAGVHQQFVGRDLPLHGDRPRSPAKQ